MELKSLRDKCILFNQFMSENSGLPPQLANAFTESNRLIELAYLQGKIEPLKSLSIDIDNQVLNHMPLTMAIKFKNLIKSKLNIDYEVIDKALNKAIEVILKKGKISNTEEYELIINRIDEIYTDTNQVDEMKHLNMLLTDYEM